MQQAIYNTISISNNAISNSSNTGQTAKTTGLVRWIARKWDQVAVVVLMGTSLAYGVFALTHTGL